MRQTVICATGTGFCRCWSIHAHRSADVQNRAAASQGRFHRVDAGIRKGRILWLKNGDGTRQFALLTMDYLETYDSLPSTGSDILDLALGKREFHKIMICLTLRAIFCCPAGHVT